ncbi:tetratricopeptide repeat protein [Pedobacter panaciterrae]
MKKLILILLFSYTSFLCSAQSSVDEGLAFQYYQQGQYQEASVLLEKLFNATKNDTYFDLWYTSLIKLKKLDEAEKIAKKLIKQNPKNLHYTMALARVYQEKGQIDAANKAYSETLNNLLSR